MRIQYQKGDPRHGSIAEVEGRRAKQLIDSGAAKEVGRDIAPETPGRRAGRQLVEQTRKVRKNAAKKAAAKKA